MVNLLTTFKDFSFPKRDKSHLEKQFTEVFTEYSFQSAVFKAQIYFSGPNLSHCSLPMEIYLNKNNQHILLLLKCKCAVLLCL